MHLQRYVMQTYTVICIHVHIKTLTCNTMKLNENWKTWIQMSINGKYKRKEKYIPHTLFLIWAYCIRIWWMLSTLFRSTRHSAVSLRPDSTHSPPQGDRFSFLPSTANEALYWLLRGGFCCQAALCRATFSKRTKYIYRIIPAYTYNVHVCYTFIFSWTAFSYKMIRA